MQVITKDILENSKVVFDTNTLIELYFYPEPIIELLVEKMFSKLDLWLPNHVYTEYDSKREEKKNAACDSYMKLSGQGPLFVIENSLSKTKSNFDKLLEETDLSHKHPYFDKSLFDDLKESLDKYSTDLEPILKTIKTKIDEKVKSIEDSEDSIFKIIIEHFNTGRQYSFSEKLQIAQEGKIRFDLKVPPGWADAIGKNAKEGMQKYADLIIWKQICEESKNSDKDILLISNEYSKEDWCNRVPKENKIESPKKELIEELLEVSGKKFYMITLSQLVYVASKEFGFEIDTSILSEIDTSQSVSILDFNVNNHDNEFWGIHQSIMGKCYVSNEIIKFDVQELELTNTKGVNFNVKSISANIGYMNENGRWDILVNGDKFEIGSDCYPQGFTLKLDNFDLFVDRSEVPDLEGKWIIFQIETLSDQRTTIGTMYNHWEEFKITPHNKP